MQVYKIKWKFLSLLGIAVILSLVSFVQAQKDPVKICLAMILQNDESVIESCLSSVSGIVDCVCICTSGVNDRTLDIVEFFGRATGIPVKIYPQEWAAGQQNKTELVLAAQQMMKELRFPLNTSYILTLDPNQELRIEYEFHKRRLQEDAYLLLEKTPTLATYQLHLLRASFPWKSIGKERGYWVTERLLTHTKLRGLVVQQQIDEKEEDRLQKEIEISLARLALDPGNPSHLFSLAQSYRAMGRVQEALFNYKLLIPNEKEKEKVWFSKYMVAECHELLGEWGDALYWYLEAYQDFPDRAESLGKVAAHYRNLSQNNLAYIFAKYGTQVPFPENQQLFSTAPFEEYQFLEELSIAAYYTPFKEEGLKAASDLTITKEAPRASREQAYRNMLFYVEKLPKARFQPIEVDLPLIREGFEERYHPMNPSICKVEHGYKLNCRAVNYTQVGAKVFETIDEQGMFRTKNFLINYTDDFTKVSQQEVIENLPRERICSLRIDGLEDCRIFQFDHDIWFTCTTGDTNPTGTLQTSLCKLEMNSFGKKIFVEKLVPLKGPDPYRCEKNWLPFIKDGQLYTIYSYDPFIINKPNIETGEWEVVHEHEPPYDFSSFRGSAAPIPFDDGYLMIVHEVVFLPDYSRCYLHRFLYLDKEFMLTKASVPFVFQHQGVEYCCSMVLDSLGRQLVIPIGIEDREAYLCFLDLDVVYSLLNPLSRSSVK